MDTPNLHIEEFLKYYYSFEQEPGYAVLLKGKWGTGKTWFIKRTLNSFSKKNGKHLYVSLYGVTSFDQIEDEFFKQLHPLLSSKSMALTGKIAKGLLKATLKIDLDHDGKSDGSVSAQAPDLNLPEYLTNTSGFVIVFDDLERASMNLEALLGYINHYVEHQGYKVIIIANEEEIIAHQEKQEDFKIAYKRIKEKLIGKSFEINPDLSDALVNFISEMRTVDTQELYNKNINLISELYESSQYQNLRHLKQALWDFDRFLKNVSEDASSKDGLLEHLLKLFLILSFEIKSGSILPRDILKIRPSYFSNIFERDPNKIKDTQYQRITKKYNNVNLKDLLIEESIWIDFFDKGCCSKEKIQESLEKSEYYSTESTPDWVKLWHFMELSDDEFSIALESVKNNFYNKNYSELGVVRHVTGIFLWLSKIELIQQTKLEILDFSRSYVEHLKSSGKLNTKWSNRPRFIENESWSGLGFHERESEEFMALNEHIEQVSKIALIEDYPKAGVELIDLIDKNPSLFYRKVVLNNDSENVFYETPIFKYIDSDTFVEAFLSASPKSRNTICYAFSERYKIDRFNSSLIPELDWLKKVNSLLEEKRQLLNGKISSYQVQSYINNYFRPAVAALEQFEAKNKTQSGN